MSKTICLHPFEAQALKDGRLSQLRRPIEIDAAQVVCPYGAAGDTLVALGLGRLEITKVRRDRAKYIRPEDCFRCGVEGGGPGKDIVPAHGWRSTYEEIWQKHYGERYPWHSAYVWILDVKPGGTQ